MVDRESFAPITARHHGDTASVSLSGDRDGRATWRGDVGCRRAALLSTLAAAAVRGSRPTRVTRQAGGMEQRVMITEQPWQRHHSWLGGTRTHVHRQRGA